jgi:putative ATP-dependent endonuclease of OLD family
MYLAELKLWNFRKFGPCETANDKPSVCIPFKKGLNVLIGENDSGKTAIVDAVKLLLKTHSRDWIWLDPDDFHGGTSWLRVECIFKDFTDIEASHFIEWLGWEGSGDSAKPYLRVFLQAQKDGEKVLPFDIRAGVDDQGSQLDAGAREYFKTTYLKPLRDAENELIPRKNSRLSQILSGHDVFRKNGSEKHPLEGHYETFKDAVRSFFAAGEAGHSLKDAVDTYVIGLGASKANLDPEGGELKEILEALKLQFEEKNMGLGSFNLLSMAAELVHLSKSNYTGLRLGLIEEVEAHLHPPKQMELIEFLQYEAQSKGVQIILTTHSPNIGSKIKLDNLFLCHKGNVYPLGQDSVGKSYTKLDPTDYSFLERFLDATKANLFFSKGVVLVEGWSEELLIPALAKKVLGGDTLAKRGVSVVNVGSTAFLRYSKIFQRLDEHETLCIPVAVITDLDIKPEDEVGRNLTDEITKKMSKYEGQKVKTFVSPRWTLEFCLALSPNLRKMFFDAVKAAGEEMVADGYAGKKVEGDYQSNCDQLPDADAIASKIYVETMKQKKISKPVVAQHLAKAIDEDKATNPPYLSDPSLTYLIDAIKYACNEN